MGNFGRGVLFALNFNTDIRVEVIMIIWEINKIPGKQCCLEGGGVNISKQEFTKRFFPLYFINLHTCMY